MNIYESFEQLMKVVMSTLTVVAISNLVIVLGLMVFNNLFDLETAITYASNTLVVLVVVFMSLLLIDTIVESVYNKFFN